MEAFRHDDPTINMVRRTSDFFKEIKIVYAVHVCTIKKNAKILAQTIIVIILLALLSTNLRRVLH